jgi:thiol-disulfide isomerase/thioredoxin
MSLLVSPGLLADENVQQATHSKNVAAAEPKADLFVLPRNPTAGRLKRFITRLRRPSVRFQSRQGQQDYYRKASRASIEAADQLIEVAQQEEELDLALQTKLSGLNTLGQLGDADAQAASAEFLPEMMNHERPIVASSAKRLNNRIMFARWQGSLSRQRTLQPGQTLDATDRLGPEDKQRLFEDLSASLDNDTLSVSDVRLASNIANTIGDTEDRGMAIDLMEKMLPRLQASENQALLAMAPKLEGLLRRLKLPGNFMEVEGQLVSGEPFDWDAYRGKVVLVDFWATWCGPCIAELPNVKQEYANYHSKGFDVVGISLDESSESVAQFLQARDIPWATLYSNDPSATGWDHPMAIRYGVRGIPRAILVDQQGNVVHMNARGEHLRQQLEQLLGQPAAPTTGEQP